MNKGTGINLLCSFTKTTSLLGRNIFQATTSPMRDAAYIYFGATITAWRSSFRPPTTAIPTPMDAHTGVSTRKQKTHTKRICGLDSAKLQGALFPAVTLRISYNVKVPLHAKEVWGK